MTKKTSTPMNPPFTTSLLARNRTPATTATAQAIDLGPTDWLACPAALHELGVTASAFSVPQSDKDDFKPLVHGPRLSCRPELRVYSDPAPKA
jgi:hypothetical protein